MFRARKPSVRRLVIDDPPPRKRPKLAVRKSPTPEPAAALHAADRAEPSGCHNAKNKLPRPASDVQHIVQGAVDTVDIDSSFEPSMQDAEIRARKLEEPERDETAGLVGPEFILTDEDEQAEEDDCVESNIEETINKASLLTKLPMNSSRIVRTNNEQLDEDSECETARGEEWESRETEKADEVDVGGKRKLWPPYECNDEEFVEAHEHRHIEPENDPLVDAALSLLS